MAAQTGTITEDEFFATYKPLHDEHGNIRYFCRHSEQDLPLIQQAHKERRLWTYHHGEYNSTYFWSGFHIVNVLDYVICEVPYGKQDDLIAEDPDQTISDECSWCGKFHEDLTEAEYDALQSGKPCSAKCKGDPDYEPDEED